MTAATADPVPAAPASAPTLTPVAASAAPAAPDDSAQLRAEATLFRTAMKGALIGVVVCAAIWVGLVAIAVGRNGTALGPVLTMGAVCGVFAGLFLGGCAGALAGSRALERVEHERLHGSHA